MRRIAAALAALVVLVACASSNDESQKRRKDGDTSGAAGAAPSPSERAAKDPRPGAPGVGDPYYPTLGNGGYDVDHYDLDLRWDPDHARLDGVVTIQATATQDLSRFDLDFGGLPISKATVAGKAATTAHQGDHELVVTPAAPIAKGSAFTTTIAYGGKAESEKGILPGLGGWEDDGREVYVASEPDGAHGFFPVNDHPSDKATYTVDVTAPEALTVAAGGTLTSTKPGPTPGTKTWRFDMRQPMASYLLQVIIANLDVTSGRSRGGVVLRHAVDKDTGVRAGVGAMAETGDMIDFYAGLFGKYPFDLYGNAIIDEPIAFALETQTMSLFPADIDEETVAHELAHQWFGDDVSLQRWPDIWLNEGFATYMSWLWLEHAGHGSVDARVRAALAQGDRLDVPPANPGGPDNLFDETVYVRGAATLYVLQQKVGDDAFFKILRTWVQRYGGRSATSADFEKLAAQVSGKDLKALFDTWLRSDELPRLQEWVR